MLLFLSVAGVIGYVVGPERSVEVEADPTDFIPSDAACMLRVGALGRRFQHACGIVDSGLRTRIESPQFKSALPDTAKVFLDFIIPAEDQLRELMRRPVLRKLLGQDVTVAVVNRDGFPADSGCRLSDLPCLQKWLPHVVVVASPADPVDLTSYLLSASSDASAYAPDSYRGHTVQSVYLGNGEVLYFAWVSGRWIGTWSYPLLAEMINTAADRRHVPGWAAALKKIRKRLGGDLRGAVYVDLAQWAHAFGETRSGSSGIWQGGKRLVHVAVRQNDRMVRCQTEVTRSGNFGKIDTPVSAGDCLPFRDLVPKQTAGILRLPSAEFMERCLSVTGVDRFQKLLNAVEDRTGLSRDMLIRCFGQDVGLLVSVPRKYASTTLPDAALVVPVNTPDIIENVIYTLFASKEPILSKPVEIHTLIQGNIQITVLDVPEAEPMKPAYAFVDGQGLFATHPKLIQQMLAARETGQNMAEDPDFRAMGFGQNQGGSHFLFLAPDLLAKGMNTLVRYLSKVPVLTRLNGATDVFHTLQHGVHPLLRGFGCIRTGAVCLTDTEAGLHCEQVLILTPER